MLLWVNIFLNKCVLIIAVDFIVWALHTTLERNDVGVFNGVFEE